MNRSTAYRYGYSLCSHPVLYIRPYPAMLIRNLSFIFQEIQRLFTSAIFLQYIAAYGVSVRHCRQLVRLTADESCTDASIICRGSSTCNYQKNSE